MHNNNKNEEKKERIRFIDKLFLTRKLHAIHYAFATSSVLISLWFDDTWEGWILECGPLNLESILKLFWKGQLDQQPLRKTKDPSDTSTPPRPNKTSPK